MCGRTSLLGSSTGVPAREENVVEELSFTEIEQRSSSAIAFSSESRPGHWIPKLNLRRDKEVCTYSSVRVPLSD